MLKNKRVNILIALLIAICLWAYVTGAVDPNTTKKFTEVPIQLINEESLAQDGLAVDSTDIKSIDVSLKGNRADISKISKDDIKVTADLYGRHKGSNYITLDVQLPNGIELDSKSEDRILISIGELTTKEVSVEIKLTGDVAEDTTLGDASVSPSKMVVYGTKDNIDKVDHVQASINAKVLQSKETTHDASVEAVDSKETAVDYVTTAKEEVSVTARLLKIKKVSLKADVVGSVADGYELEEVEVPENIEIVGDEEALAKITSVTAEDIDISGISKNESIKISVKLPDGVEIKGGAVYATVKLSGADTKTFTIDGSDIKKTGLADGFEATITQDVTVSVSGKKQVISEMTKSDVVLTVDLSDLSEGRHSVTVNATSKEGVTYKISPTRVTVTIE